jgi:hypothetical protein
LYRFERGNGTFVLEGDKGVAPLVWKEVVHAAQVLAQLYEDGAILLERVEGPFSASQVAGFQLLGIVWFVVSLEDVAIAVQSHVSDIVPKRVAAWTYSLMLRTSVDATL